MKKTISLVKAVQLKKALENTRNETYAEIKEIYEKNPTDSKIVELELLRDEITELVITLNTSIQEVNLKKGKGEDRCNSDNIKLLSELTIFRNFLGDLKISDKKYNVDHTTKIKNIDRERDNLSNKLSKFNNEKKVKIEISEDLLQKITITLD
jgi:hypothetical protein